MIGAGGDAHPGPARDTARTACELVDVSLVCIRAPRGGGGVEGCRRGPHPLRDELADSLELFHVLGICEVEALLLCVFPHHLQIVLSVCACAQCVAGGASVQRAQQRRREGAQEGK